MNTPDPVQPEQQTLTTNQPVLAPQAWYHSEVQVRLVLALGAQLVSVLFRTLELTGLRVTVTQADLDLIIANLSQGAALVLAVLAIVKRQQSTVQPLTFTAAKAEQRRIDNPPLIDVDVKQLK